MKKKNKNTKNRINEIIKILLKHKVLLGISPIKLREILEELGPTYIKIGQILSLREDLLGSEYTKELSKLQSNVPAISFTEIKEIFYNEYNLNIEDIFSSFDELPIGSASISQVHKAILKDETKVVVKIQRPNLYETLKNDCILLKKAIQIIKLTNNTTALSLDIIIDEMYMILLEEINFNKELNNIEKFKELNKNIKYIDFPKTYKKYSNEKILIMEYIEGFKLNDFDNLINNGYDLKEIASKLCENFCKQILDDGFFHADPHYGNLVIRDGKILFLDMGMVGKLTNNDLLQVKKIVYAILENDITSLKEIILNLCKTTNEKDSLINHPKLYSSLNEFVEKYSNMNMKDMDISNLIFDILKITKEHELSLPNGFSLLGRAIITMQGVIKDLDPEINLIDVLKSHIKSSFLQDFDLNNELKQITKSIYSSSKKMLDIPSQFSDFLKSTNKGHTKLNVELSSDANLAKSFDKIVDKLIIAFILGVSILGSSILCTTNMNPKFLGIPLIGILGFLISFIFGIILLFKIINIRIKFFKNNNKKG